MTDSDRIVDIDVTAEMQSSFLEYSYSVIYARALPDVRDGLKPVQRRIVHQMREMGLLPSKGHVKSSRVVGDVMGKLHPHGDQAIYDALVRLAQPFSMRLPLVDGHGNFGSLDDGPAAARYTEARMSGASLFLTDEIDEDTVDFVPNYDSQLTELSVLPAAFPNLLVNGASGIAVGMATSMPPHNLGEATKAAIKVLQGGATLKSVMRIMPGPDFPGGGIISSADGIADAYETGRGSIKVRARVSIETVSARKLGLVVTELPYQVGTERVIEKIKDAVGSKKLTGISDVQDYTDRKHGLRLVIEIKNGFDPQEVLEKLYKFTPLEESFNINNIALVNGRPKTMGVIELLENFIEFRQLVTKRRTEFRLKKAQGRLHLVQGLEIAVLNIDEVIEVIRQSETVQEANQKLRDVFDLTETQAEHILELRLRRLTRFSVIELQNEREQLVRQIEEFRSILENEENLNAVVKQELEEVSKSLANPRRTQIRTSVEDAQDLVASLSCDNKLPKMPLQESQSKGCPTTFIEGELLAITAKGKAIRINNLDIPPVESPEQLESVPSLNQFLELGEDKVVSLIGWKQGSVLALGTQFGTVKRVAELSDKDSFSLIALADRDELVSASTSDDQLFFATINGQVLKFDTKTVRPQGLAAAGMQGIKLAEGDRVIGFGAAVDDLNLVTVSEAGDGLLGAEFGKAKLTSFKEVPQKGRATQGVRVQRFTKDDKRLYFAQSCSGSEICSGESRETLEATKRDATGQSLSLRAKGAH
jgi:DNA gyrase subunit A